MERKKEFAKKREQKWGETEIVDFLQKYIDQLKKWLGDKRTVWGNTPEEFLLSEGLNGIGCSWKNIFCSRKNLNETQITYSDEMRYFGNAQKFSDPELKKLLGDEAHFKVIMSGSTRAGGGRYFFNAYIPLPLEEVIRLIEKYLQPFIQKKHGAEIKRNRMNELRLEELKRTRENEKIITAEKDRDAWQNAPEFLRKAGFEVLELRDEEKVITVSKGGTHLQAGIRLCPEYNQRWVKAEEKRNPTYDFNIQTYTIEDAARLTLKVRALELLDKNQFPTPEQKCITEDGKKVISTYFDSSANLQVQTTIFQGQIIFELVYAYGASKFSEGKEYKISIVYDQVDECFYDKTRDTERFKTIKAYCEARGYKKNEAVTPAVTPMRRPSRR